MKRSRPRDPTPRNGCLAWGASGASCDRDANIRVEVICSDRLTHELAQYLQDIYYPNYAMLIFISDIEVLRPQKFGS